VASGRCVDDNHIMLITEAGIAHPHGVQRHLHRWAATPRACAWSACPVTSASVSLSNLAESDDSDAQVAKPLELTAEDAGSADEESELDERLTDAPPSDEGEVTGSGTGEDDAE
jgi:hypothetical protein